MESSDCDPYATDVYWEDLTCYNFTYIVGKEKEFNPCTLVASVLSIFGSVLVMITYLGWKDMRRSVTRTIVFWLAVADLMSAVGYLLGSTIQYSGRERYTSAFEIVCAGISAWTLYFAKTSYLWTVDLALYFVLVLVFRKGHSAKKLMIVFHLTSWLIPLPVFISLAATHWLGRGYYRTEPTFCFVSDRNFMNKSVNDFWPLMEEYFAVEAIASPLWTLLIIVVITFCYLLIFILNRCRWRKVS